MQTVTKGALVALVAAALAVPHSDAFGLTPQQQSSVNAILTTISPEAIDAGRLTCMFGEEPERVAKGRRAGKTFLPDAADTCVAILTRSAHDGRLSELYRTVLVNLGGDVRLAGKMPYAIAAAVLKGDGYGTLDIGNGKTAPIGQPMAFDAGFTVAYLKGDRRAANTDPGQLKALAESCLAIQSDPGACFSAGYAEGGRALR